MTRGPRRRDYRASFYCALLGLFVAGIVWAAVPPRNIVAEKNSAALLTPDLVLINGKILTVDPKDSIAEAIAIGGGKIIAVGASADCCEVVAGRRAASGRDDRGQGSGHPSTDMGFLSPDSRRRQANDSGFRPLARGHDDCF